MPDPVIVADAVSYSVNGAELIKGIDLASKPGELVAMAGPNGAGKSTMLSLLAGDIEPVSGSVTIGDLNTKGAQAADLAKLRSMMRQGRRSDVPFTVAAVVEMGRFPHRSDPDVTREADEEAIAVAMERVDVSHLAGRIFATLSGGEKTRVVMAQIIAQEAPVVLLDEPTTALDLAHGERALEVIRSMANDGKCVVAVLHDLNAAAHYADRIVLLKDGKVRAEGTPEEVLRPDLLEDVYRQPMIVMEHPTRGCPLVLTTDE